MNREILLAVKEKNPMSCGTQTETCSVGSKWSLYANSNGNDMRPKYMSGYGDVCSWSNFLCDVIQFRYCNENIGEYIIKYLFYIIMLKTSLELHLFELSENTFSKLNAHSARTVLINNASHNVIRFCSIRAFMLVSENYVHRINYNLFIARKYKIIRLVSRFFIFIENW